MSIKTNLKKFISGILSVTLFSTSLTCFPATAEEADIYPYTMFAGSSEEGAITINASNVCINGNIATNGTIVSSGNMNVNGSKTENAAEEMLYFFNKLDYAYFNSSNVEIHTEDYSYEDTNININVPLEVEGELELTGNINLSTGIKALEDVNLNGEVKNTNDSVICSETGDIIINTTNVNLNGLVYAPEGCVDITAQNLNMNNVIIIADTIKVECPNLNANYNSSMAEFVGTESEKELYLYVMGEYNSINKCIDLSWLTTKPDGSFDIQISNNNLEYKTYDTVYDIDTYSFPISDQEGDLYFKIRQTAKYGEVKETFAILMRKIDSGYSMELVDSDNDKLPDFVELELGTSLEIEDTDKDGLTDYEEYILTNTNPMVYNSVVIDLSDADADSDEDGLSNIYEITVGTNPKSKDTDIDDLNDNEEINIYVTSPLLEDTDEDTILDSDELKLGLDPTNPETFGVPDAEYKILQTIAADSEVFEEINTVDNPYKLSVDLACAGYADANLVAEETSYSKVIQNDSMLGIAVELKYLNTNSIDDVTLKYEISSEYIENTLNMFPDEEELTGIKRLNVFKYFEGLNMLIPIETFHDVENHLVYAETDELGTYCLMDMELWLSEFEVPEETYTNTPALLSLTTEETTTDFSEENTYISTSTDAYEEEVAVEESLIPTTFASLQNSGLVTVHTPLDVVFLLQISGNDESTFNNERQMIKDVAEVLYDTYEDVRIYIIGYKENSASFCKIYTGDAEYDSVAYIKNSVQLNAALDNIYYSYTTSYCNRGAAFTLMINDVEFRETAGKFVFQLMNGRTDVEENYFSELDACARGNINYTEILSPGSYYIDDNYAEKVDAAIAKTKGLNLVYNSQTGTTIINHIAQYIAPPQVMFNAIVPTGWKTILLDGALNSENGINSDTDGLTDWLEIDTDKLSWDTDGSILLPTIQQCINYATKPYAVDGLARFKSDQWISGMPSSDFERYLYYVMNNTYILPIHSDPTDEDSDDDGYLDYDDEEPLRFNNWEPETDFANLVQTAGFSYDPTQDIIYSNLNNVQRFFGFAQEIDSMAAFPLISQIECEPIIFTHDNKDYMIELWKGQYGLMTGAEVGIYYMPEANIQTEPSGADSIFKWWMECVNPWLSDDAYNDYMTKQLLYVLYDCTANIGKPLYYSANDEMLEDISFDLYGANGNELLFTRQGEHWWMTGFEWGIHTLNTEDLVMDIEIEFNDSSLADAFAVRLEGMGYQKESNSVLNKEIKEDDGVNYYCHTENIVRIIFKKYVTVQPGNQEIFREQLKDTTSLMADFYNGLYEYKGLINKDPNALTVNDWIDYVESLTVDKVQPWLDKCKVLNYSLEELKLFYNEQLTQLIDPVKKLYKSTEEVVSNNAAKSYEKLVDIFKFDIAVIYDYASGNAENGNTLYDYYDNWYMQYVNMYGNSNSKLNYQFYTSTVINALFLYEQLSNLSYKSIQ